MELAEEVRLGPKSLADADTSDALLLSQVLQSDISDLESARLT